MTTGWAEKQKVIAGQDGKVDLPGPLITAIERDRKRVATDRLELTDFPDSPLWTDIKKRLLSLIEAGKFSLKDELLAKKLRSNPESLKRRDLEKIVSAYQAYSLEKYRKESSPNIVWASHVDGKFKKLTYRQLMLETGGPLVLSDDQFQELVKSGRTYGSSFSPAEFSGSAADVVRKMSETHNLDERAFWGMYGAESGWNPRAGTNALGLPQITRSAAATIGMPTDVFERFKELEDAEQLRWHAKYFHHYRKYIKTGLELGLSSESILFIINFLPENLNPVESARVPLPSKTFCRGMYLGNPSLVDREAGAITRDSLAAAITRHYSATISRNGSKVRIGDIPTRAELAVLAANKKAEAEKGGA